MKNTFNTGAVEQPGQGRATITDNFNEVQIVIPAPRNAAFIAFACIWLCGWATGGVFAATTVFSELTSDREFTDFFLLFWLCGWAFGLVMVGHILIWMLLGKEIITAGQGLLTIHRKFALFKKPKTYNLNDATNFRVDVQDLSAFQFGRRRSNLNDLIGGRNILFDYGMKTIKFAPGIDEPEANHIIKLIGGKRPVAERGM